MKKYRIIAAIIALFPFTVDSLATVKDSVKFWIEAPDTIAYGQKVQVTYHLHTKEFSNVQYPTMDNFEMQSWRYPPYKSYSNPNCFRNFEWIIEVVPYKSGRQWIPPMTVSTGGHKVQTTAKEVFVKGHGTAKDAIKLKALQKFWRTSQPFIPNYRTTTPIEKHLAEAETAIKWLSSKGQKPTNIWLKEVYYNDDVVLFSDDWNRCFALIASEKYHSILDNCVLAYSLESGAEWSIELIRAYTQSLKQLTTNDRLENPIDTTFSQVPKKQVQPLLGRTCWGQGNPYNMLLSPGSNGKKKPLGPGAVACAQLMRFHQFPTVATGMRLYVNKDKILFGSTDFSKYSFDWANMQDSYQEEDEIPVSLAHLMSSCCYALETEWQGTNSTRATDMRNFKAVLVDNFGYSRGCRYVENLTDDDVTSLLYCDLDEGLPVLCRGLSNYFVCDGYEGEFFHFNMGWNGFFNGYYRTALSRGKSQSPIIEAMIIGIKPHDGRQLTRKIHLAKPGTLSEQLTNEDVLTITQLELSGKINAEDMKLIRRMAGAPPVKSPTEQTGQLSVLDISNVVFDEDNKSYLQKDASDYVFSRSNLYYEIDRKSLGNMSKDEWEAMRSRPISQGDGYHFNNSKSGKRFVYFTLKDNTITPFLFEDCDNLTQIQLPINTKKIEDGAFRHCNSLKQIELPPALTILTDGCFMQCYQLETVSYQSKKGLTIKEAIHGKLQLTEDEKNHYVDSGPFMGNNKITCKGLKKKE